MHLSVIGVIPYRPITNYLLNIPNKFPEYLAGGLAIACELRVRWEDGERERLWLCLSIWDGDILASSIIRLLSDQSSLDNMRSNSMAHTVGSLILQLFILLLQATL